MADVENTSVSLETQSDYTPTLRIDDALRATTSPSTKRNYRYQLNVFDRWLNGRSICYDSVLDYRGHLLATGWTPQNINQALSAIRFYAATALEGRWMEPAEKTAICEVKTLRVLGRKMGHWLTVKDVENLLNQPSTMTPSGLRDRAILALLVGAGLRRSELCALQVKHFEQRDAGDDKKRWVLVGITGKHNRTRNIPIADWIKALVDQWVSRVSIRSGYVFRSVRNDPYRLSSKPLTGVAIYLIVEEYAKKIGREQVKPHDLRRTFARLSFKGGAGLTEIQQSLGHGSVAVTERYVNAVQDIEQAPSDMLGVNIDV